MTDLMIPENRREVQELKTESRALVWCPRAIVLLIMSVGNFLIQSFDASTFFPFSFHLPLYATIGSVLAGAASVYFHFKKNTNSFPSWVLERSAEILELIKIHNKAAKGFVDLLHARALLHGHDPKLGPSLKSQQIFFKLRQLRLERILAFLDAIRGHDNTRLATYERLAPTTKFDNVDLQNAFQELIDDCSRKPEEIGLLTSSREQYVEFMKPGAKNFRELLRTERELLLGQALLPLDEEEETVDAVAEKKE